MKSITRFTKNIRGNECLNCGTHLTTDDNFCGRCGQVNDTKRLSVKQYFSEYLSGFLNFDNRFLKTVIPLVFKPGFVTKEYVDGKRHGLYHEYYESGELWKDWHFVDDLEEGTSLWYFEDGTLSMEWNYIRGKLEGLSKWYYETGELWAEPNYINGLKNGFTIPNGNSGDRIRLAIRAAIDNRINNDAPYLALLPG